MPRTLTFDSSCFDLAEL